MTAHRAALILAVVAAAAILLAQAQAPDQRPPGPADLGLTDKGVRFQVPKTKPVAPRELQPLRVAGVEVHVLAEGTHAGAAGDLLLTFQGQGFLETAKAPRVELGKAVFDDTMANAEGTQLFVILPRQRVPELERLQFNEIVVVNPGGLEKTNYKRTIVRATARDLRPAPGAPHARLVFRGGVFARELVRP